MQLSRVLKSFYENGEFFLFQCRICALKFFETTIWSVITSDTNAGFDLYSAFTFDDFLKFQVAFSNRCEAFLGDEVLSLRLLPSTSCFIFTWSHADRESHSSLGWTCSIILHQCGSYFCFYSSTGNSHNLFWLNYKAASVLKVENEKFEIKDAIMVLLLTKLCISDLSDVFADKRLL